MSRRSMRVPNISASAAYPASLRWPISSTIAQSSNGSAIALAACGLAAVGQLAVIHQHDQPLPRPAPLQRVNARGGLVAGQVPRRPAEQGAAGDFLADLAGIRLVVAGEAEVGAERGPHGGELVAGDGAGRVVIRLVRGGLSGRLGLVLAGQRRPVSRRSLSGRRGGGGCR